jgi:crossover junction endodeoxyribonuclease RuvC
MSKEPLVIFGVDPGTQITGFGVIRTRSHILDVLDFGCIRPPTRLSCHERYLIIFEGIEALLDKHKPDALAVETQFFYRNAQSAMKLGIARGMALLAATRRKIPIFEYAPKKAKLAVVGHGSASKEQVQRMIQLLLKLPSPPTPEDAADALAIALCHAHTIKSPLDVKPTSAAR